MPAVGLFDCHSGPKLVKMLTVALLRQRLVADLCLTSMFGSFATSCTEVLTVWKDWAEIYCNNLSYPEKISTGTHC